MPAPTAYALEGRVVTMNEHAAVVNAGRVYVDGNTIIDVREAAAPAPDGFEDAPVLRTGGTVYPGLIELHNHLAYDVLPLWPVPRRYTNRGQWGGSSLEYRRSISGPMKVLGRVRGYIEAVARYTEMKCLVGGVTTSQGVALFSNSGSRRYYRGLVRNVEQGGDPDLPAAEPRVADIEAQSAAAFRARLEESSCLLLHLSEGVDDTARAHFRALRVDTDTWAITDALAGIHCAGLRGRDFATMRSRGGTMVWSPFSNLLLYGDTADIARAVDEDLRIALGSDWSPSGSKSLLGEMKVAWLVAQDRNVDVSARDIVAMATTNPARILKWDRVLGSLEAGKRADMIVVHGRDGDPYEHLLRARETGIVLVAVDGKPRYGQPRLLERFVDAGETLEIGGSARVVDLRDASGDPVVGALTFAEARERLADGMQRLSELAGAMEGRGVAAASMFGATSDEEDGRWFLELDHDTDPEFSLRPRIATTDPAAGAVPDLFAAVPLSNILTSVTLDPLTVVDDPAFFDNVASARNLPEYIVRELPPLYGEPSRVQVRPSDALGAVPDEAGGWPRLADVDGEPPQPLTSGERALLVEQAMVMLGETYVHLSLKRSMHAVDPLQRLRLLRYRLDQPAAAGMSDLDFHREMSAIFASLHDLHTNYLLPSPYRERTAFLPFLVEECFDDDGPHYVVTRVLEGFERPPFEPGVDVLHWNGVPIQRAVTANGREQAGSNPAAQFARGLEALCIRPLIRSSPPQDDWVVVTYRALDGDVREARWDWLVSAPPASGVDPDAGHASARATALGYDVLTDRVNAARKTLFAPRASALERAQRGATGRRAAVAVDEQDLATTMPTVFRARAVETSSGTFGHLRIFTFNVEDADEFVEEFSRLASSLPQDGLVIDVRSNGGGLIYAAERLLQTLSPRRIEPSRSQFLTTPLMLDLCERHAPSPLDPAFDLSPWVESMRQAVTTGAVYSQALPITDTESANAIGQRYQGPVVLVTDALCYSATDMFAAGFRDHQIGTILGTADNTGAGGANVWTHELLRTLLDAPRPDATRPNPFRVLPAGAAMRVAVRRTTRVGALDGTPLEDLGVEPDQRHYLTRDDAMHANRDLLEHAGHILAESPHHRLRFDVQRGPSNVLDLTIDVENIDRIDVWVDGRPTDSFDVDGGAGKRQFHPPTPDPHDVELRGHLDGVPVARAHSAVPR
jgi:cytosine/adenosine deaminase-related metal-dependent hydrolase